jgi:voltage-gated potassium channel
MQDDQQIRTRVRRIIFEVSTPAGKIFDYFLIVCILLSVVAVMLDSVETIRMRWSTQFDFFEWVFTILFTLEYGVRLWSAKSALRYARSFFGIIDLIAIVPTYLSLIIPGTEFLIVIRSLRILRIFRVFKLFRYVKGSNIIVDALINSRFKITVFILAVLILVINIGAFMYVIESEESGFSNIPISIYWAIVTLTTVGYGDLSPQTPGGQILASIVMLMGYSIIAVPTGIVTAEVGRSMKISQRDNRTCLNCSTNGHDPDAIYCRECGHELQSE